VADIILIWLASAWLAGVAYLLMTRLGAALIGSYSAQCGIGVASADAAAGLGGYHRPVSMAAAWRRLAAGVWPA
jgi:hypothetical protein